MRSGAAPGPRLDDPPPLHNDETRERIGQRVYWPQSSGTSSRLCRNDIPQLGFDGFDAIGDATAMRKTRAGRVGATTSFTATDLGNPRGFSSSSFFLPAPAMETTSLLTVLT